jgi:adenosylhomocysteine nucleosidase
MLSVEMIAIVAAMPEELAPLVARAEGARELSVRDGHPWKLVTARLAGRAVALAVTGDGARNARLGAEGLGASLAMDGLIVVGIAGAATGDLPPGALVVAEEVRPEGGGGWRADPGAVDVAVRRAGARAACLVSGHDIADTPAAKRALAARAGDAHAPVAVDLESATYVEAAARAGVPWTVLRVISDAADETVPALVNRSRDAGGAVRRGAVALRLLGNPAALPVLLRLRARMHDAAATLADAVERVLLAT